MQIYKWVPARVEENNEKQTSDSKQQASQQNGSESTDQNGVQISPESQEEKKPNGIANGSIERLESEANSNTNSNSNDKIVDKDSTTTTTSTSETSVPQLSSLDRKTPEPSSNSGDDQQSGTKDTDPGDSTNRAMEVDEKPANNERADSSAADAKDVKLESMEVDEPKKDEATPVSELADTTATRTSETAKKDEAVAFEKSAEEGTASVVGVDRESDKE